MWVDAGLNWNDFLPEDQDMNKFVTEQVSRITGKSKGNDVITYLYTGNDFCTNTCTWKMSLTLQQHLHVNRLHQL